jgi:predicted secreted hydrolase
MARACLLVCFALLAACSGADRPGARGAGGGPRSASQLDVLRGGTSDQRFARPLGIRTFEFPQDFGPHPAYREEWWYFTGHLRTAAGARFGFELTFFRVALAPPPGGEPATGEPATGEPTAVATPMQSRWRTRQIYVAHFAITDVARKEFHSTQRFARDALGLAGSQATPFRVWLNGWSVAEATRTGQAPTSGNAVVPADAATSGESGLRGAWTLRAADPAYGLTLELRPDSPPVLNGDRGLSIKSDVPGSATYYYSIPRLEAHGQLVRGGQVMDVSGTAWLDREWGSGSLGPDEQGWDWFGLQLDDGSALMFYALRDLDGARDPHSAGTWIGPDGRSRALSSADVRIDVLGHWRSPRGGLYPSRWRVRVSSLGLDVGITPVLAGQELDTTPRYWEGDVDVAGARDGRNVAGQGYVELVGYAR